MAWTRPDGEVDPLSYGGVEGADDIADHIRCDIGMDPRRHGEVAGAEIERRMRGYGQPRTDPVDPRPGPAVPTADLDIVRGRHEIERRTVVGVVLERPVPDQCVLDQRAAFPGRQFVGAYGGTPCSMAHAT